MWYCDPGAVVQAMTTTSCPSHSCVTSKLDQQLPINSLFVSSSFKTKYRMVRCVKPETNMLIKFHMFAISSSDIYGRCMCHIHVQVTSINHVTRSNLIHTLKIHLILLAYITEQILLPECKHDLHCSHSMLASRSNTGTCAKTH